MYRIRPAKHLLQTLGRGLRQIGIKPPIRIGREAPLVQFQSQFDLRGGAPAARRGVSQGEAASRIVNTPLRLIPKERAVVRVMNHSVPIEGGAGDRAGDFSLPRGRARDRYGLRV